MNFISLLTDFGLQDEYVGVMKAVIASINPAVRTIDITHQIEAQDIGQAAYVLKAAYRYFPPDTVHLAVVDPHVGGSRRIVAVKAGGYIFLGPDNGILCPAVEDTGEPQPEVVVVSNSGYFLPDVSRTFHGRDIFAPVAAHLTMGTSLGQLGPGIEFSKLVKPQALTVRRLADGSLQGIVIGVDHFGNILTNIERKCLVEMLKKENLNNLEIKISGWTLQGLGGSYADVAVGQPLALIGSRDTLELAVNHGQAADVLKAGPGDKVVVIVKKDG